jgi:DNA-binding beta-propeller fold protein YncE
VGEQNFLGAGFRNPQGEISLLLERSGRTSALRDDLAAAARDISAALPGSGSRIRSLISAGEQPERENLNPSAAANSPSPAQLLDAASRKGNYSARWRFDLALRLAATDLLPGEKKRGVIFITSGRLGELAFEQYSLSELAAYLSNNNIVFHAVIVGGGPVGEEIRYLCEETGGRALPLYRNEGVGTLIRSIAAYPSGAYTLSYRSVLPTDFGRAYLPVEAAVYLMERSGRDGTGYFVPLE